MNRENKNQIIEQLADKLNNNGVMYLSDISGLDAETTSKLRRICFNKNISLQVVKNTLLKKAMEKVDDKDFEGMYDVLKGNTAIMFAEAGNAPAKMIKEFRKKSERPILKAAYVEESVYLGDEQLEMLTSLKSKDELIGDVILLLQSPAKTVISQLTSGQSKLAGIVKTLSEREA